MKRILLLVLSVSILLALYLPGNASAKEEHVVLTIGDTTDRSGQRVDGDDQLGVWRYLEDQLNVEIRYVYLSQEDYAAGLASGNLPDIVVTDNNLPEIRENGVALKRADGEFELLAYPHNMLVGGLKKARYQNREFELRSGDCLFVYTDGVTEAANPAGEMFREKRLAETLNRYADAKPEELIRCVQDAVDLFADSAEQFDDITMLCFRYGGTGKMEPYTEEKEGTA